MAMAWDAFAGLMQGAIGSRAFRIEAQLNNKLRKLAADSRNTLRMASNEAAAAKGSLARWTQSVNNNRRLKAGGEALEANTVNALRGQDAATSRTFADGVANAEQMGRMAASAAFNGLGGDVVDQVNLSVDLRNGIVGQAFADQQDVAAYDTARRAGSIMSQMIGGLDNSVIMDAIDYNIDVAQEDAVFSTWQNALFGMIKHSGGVSSDPTPKDNTYNAGETHGTDFTGKAKFDFTDDQYLTLDSDRSANEWTDRAIGSEKSYTFGDENTWGQNTDNYANAWSSNSEYSY
jgi:hypothetical protein